MGSYLTRPITKKISDNQENGKLVYGVSSMQGWRTHQEDAHNCILDFDEETSLFGVYDGHGGAEVAIYTAEKLPEFIKDDSEYKNGNYKEALISAFLTFDDTLKSPEAVERLHEIKKSESMKRYEKKLNDSDADAEESGASTIVFAERPRCSHSEENGDDDDADADYEYGDIGDPETETPDSLRRDASRPLEEVMASYRIPHIGKLIASEYGKKPASPYLRGRRDGAGGSGECSSSFSGECSSSFAQPGPSSSNECSSSSSSNDQIQKEIDESGDAKAKSATNGDSEESSSSAELKEQSEEISESSKISKQESSNSSPSKSLVNGSSNLKGEVNDEVETSKSSTTEESPSKSEEKPSCSTPSKKKKLALTDLDDSDVIKNFITKEDIDETDEDDSEDETFQLGEGGDSESDEDDFGTTGESLLEKLKRRLCQAAMAAEIDDDDDDEDYDENNDASDDNEEEEEDEDADDDSDKDSDDDETCIRALGRDDDNEIGGVNSGCTAVVALIKGNTLYVANAGDSRCVICKDGQAVDMSEDHKPEDELERTRIEKAGGMVTMDGRVNGNLNLSRAIGDHDFKRNTSLPNTEQMICALPDVRICKLEPDVEFVVLACDGIWNSMSSQEVVNFIRPKIQSNQKLSAICEELFDSCLAPNTINDGTGCDNMTCIIVQIHHDGDKKTVEIDSNRTSVPESTKTIVPEKTETSESVDAKVSVSENAEVDSTPSELPKPADNSQSEKDDNNEAVPTQPDSSEMPSEPETKNETNSSSQKRCADSTEEYDHQAKRQKTDTNDDSS